MAAKIHVIGLGPSGPEFVTDQTRGVIEKTKVGFVRTRRHQSASLVDTFRSFDDIYESEVEIDRVYQSIVERLIAAATENQEITYAVPGSPLVAEHTIELLRERSEVELEIYPAMSFLDLCWERLGIDPLGGHIALVNGHDWNSSQLPSGAGVLVSQCDDVRVLSDIKLSVDADETPVVVLQRLGHDDESVLSIALHELDRVVTPDHLTSLWIPELPETTGDRLAQLAEIADRLRVECPWDAKQTHHSLTKHLIEETYEAIEAIGMFGILGGYESESPAIGDAINHVIEELGDVLAQVFFHAAIASQEGVFTIDDIADSITQKLIRRHPHVFSDTVVNSLDEVESNWAKIKEAEGKTDKRGLDIPHELPALMFASELRKQSGKRGFQDWSVADLIKDVRDEVRELEEAYELANGELTEDVFSEFGDILYAAVGLAHVLGIDAEASLRATSGRIRERYLRCEDLMAADGKTIGELSPEEIIRYWKAAKPQY